MRLVIGIILGVVLTVGLAYVSDLGRHNSCPAAEGRPLVNWDEVAVRYQSISAAIEADWHKLTGH